jgi:hypothetical protein
MTLTIDEALRLARTKSDARHYPDYIAALDVVEAADNPLLRSNDCAETLLGEDYEQYNAAWEHLDNTIAAFITAVERESK